jgi:hypothetical protein
VNTSLNGSGEWRLAGPEGVIELRVGGPFSANNSDDVRIAALTGLGIAMLPELHASDDLSDGRLVRVLGPWESERMPLVLAYPSRRFLAPRTRAVIDFIVAEMPSHRVPDALTQPALATDRFAPLLVEPRLTVLSQPTCPAGEFPGEWRSAPHIQDTRVA